LGHDACFRKVIALNVSKNRDVKGDKKLRQNNLQRVILNPASSAALP
jgi:hypothetical protein